MKSAEPKLKYATLAAVVLLLMLRGAPAFGIFENYNLYGLGSNAFSLGSPAMPSDYDEFSFLSNPAMIMESNSTHYALALGTLSASLTNRSYKYTLFTIARPPKSAWTLSSSKDADLNRNMLTYTWGSGNATMKYGANISGYKFDYNFIDSRGAVQKDNATGFTIDLGAVYPYGDKTKIGVSFENLLSSVGARKGTTSARASAQPIVLSIGVSHRLNKDMAVNFSTRAFKGANKAEGGAKEKSFNSMSIGFEYFLPSNIAFRMAGGQNSALEGQRDRMAFAGLDWRTDSYAAGYAFMNKNAIYSPAKVITIAYKTSGTWEPLEASAQAAVAATGTPSLASQTPVFEKPLPVVKKPVNELPVGIIDDTYLPPERPPQPASSPVPIEPPQPVTRPLEITDISIDPKAIIVPAPGRTDFSDIGGHPAEKYIRQLSDEGFYPAAASSTFMPDELIPNEEFYRLVFLMQLEKLFSKPIAILFTTPKPARASVILTAPQFDSPLPLVKGTYEKSGMKRIVLDSKLLSAKLRERNSAAGRYKLNVHLATSENEEGDISDSITVLDTSIDFSALTPLQGDERKKRAVELIGRLKSLGLNLEYLEAMQSSGRITRVQALESALTALDLNTQNGNDNALEYTDTGSLTAREKKAIYYGTRPISALGDDALMYGYTDKTFKPDSAITRADAAALIAKAIVLTPEDFERPGAAGAKPQAIPGNRPVAPHAPIVTTQPQETHPARPPSLERREPVNPENVPVNPDVIMAPPSANAGPTPPVICVPSVPSVSPPAPVFRSAPPSEGGAPLNPVTVNSAPVETMQPGQFSYEPPPLPPAETGGTIKPRKGGIAPPQYVVQPPAGETRNTRYLVVAKSSITEQDAWAAAIELQKKGVDAKIFTQKTGDTKTYHVVTGSYETREEAETAAAAVPGGFSPKIQKAAEEAACAQQFPTAAKAPPLPAHRDEREVILNTAPQKKETAAPPQPYIIDKDE